MRTDIRIQNTQKALKDALRVLLKKKGAESISISELCSKAGVNRSTFYKYYKDISELLYDMQNDYYTTLKEIMERNNYEVTQKYILEIIESLKQNYCAFGDFNTFFSFRTPYAKSVSGNFRQMLVEQWKAKHPDLNEFQAEYTYVFLHGGMTVLLESWIKDGMPGTTNEICNVILNFYQMNLS